MDAVATVRKLGLSEKAAKVYVAALELGEATVQDLAKRSKLKRTTVYYVLSELTDAGALVLVKREKKWYYQPTAPRAVVRGCRERVSEVEEVLDELEQLQHAVFPRPRTYFLYGPSGFKRLWDMIFATSDKEFLITTPGHTFPEYVHEKYIMKEIIGAKRTQGIKSRQLITDSAYARKIVAKDMNENRTSKFLPSRYPLLFSEIVCTEFVALASPRFDNVLMVVECESFAQTRRNLFEILWHTLPTHSTIRSKK